MLLQCSLLTNDEENAAKTKTFQSDVFSFKSWSFKSWCSQNTQPKKLLKHATHPASCSTMPFLRSGKNSRNDTFHKLIRRQGKDRKSRSLRHASGQDETKTNKPASIGGTYSSMLSRSDSHRLTDSDRSFESSWTPSSSQSHHKHSPLIARSSARPSPVRTRTNKVHAESDDVEELAFVLERSQNLPGTDYYASNHILVNKERTKRLTPPLIRRSKLDELAREHAMAMAAKDALMHSDPDKLLQKVGQPSRRLGENVAYGRSIREIHTMMMKEKGSDKNNIVDRRFVTMGMGTAPGPDGGLYMCQIFRG